MPSSNAIGTRIERRRRRGGEVWGGLSPSPLRRGLGRGLCPSPEKLSILDLKWANFGANWALFVQFT